MEYIDKSGYFWYSEKQAEAIMLNGRMPSKAMIDGEEMSYTEWTQRPETSSSWNDMHLLGFGYALNQVGPSKG